jgi:hypothetical protein
MSSFSLAWIIRAVWPGFSEAIVCRAKWALKHQKIALEIRRKLLVLKEWLGGESNSRHEDFQSSALPTELPSRLNGERAI